MSAAHVSETLGDRRSTLVRMQQDKITRYVVRFLQDNTYMVADRGIVVNTKDDELFLGAKVEVVYDKSSKLSATAVILYIGHLMKANELERQLSDKGVEKEKEVLSAFDEAGNEESAYEKPKTGKRRGSKVRDGWP